MPQLTISTNTADQWVTELDVTKGVTVQVAGTFVGTVTVQRRPAASVASGFPWTTVDTLTSPIVRVADDHGTSDYRVGLSLSADYTSGTIYCSIQSANHGGFL